MSVSFKKPIKRNVRKKQADGDSDEERCVNAEPITSSENVAEPISLVSGTVRPTLVPKVENVVSDKTESAPVSSAATGMSKLSFGDDEGDTEEFRIKKSSRSRKLASKVKDERKEKSEEGNLREKYGVDSSQHRQEEPGNAPTLYDEDMEEEEGSQFRHPSRFLNGNIPDRSTIEEMKKLREAARRNDEDEYIPLDDTDRLTDSKSRLIREDENDLSDEDEELVIGGQNKFMGAKEKEAANRRRNREFFELDEMIGQVAEDSDEEIQRWEESQIRKGVTLPQIQAFSDEINRPSATSEPFAFSTYDGYYLPNPVEQAPITAMNTVEDIHKKIRNRMEMAKDLQRRHFSDADKISSELLESNKAVDMLDKELKSASYQYKFYQEMRGYIMDIIDCFNEKLPKIVEMENEVVATWRRGAAMSRELRQLFIKDQDDEIHCKHSG